jgi:hypothetical protein
MSTIGTVPDPLARSGAPSTRCASRNTPSLKSDTRLVAGVFPPRLPAGQCDRDHTPDPDHRGRPSIRRVAQRSYANLEASVLGPRRSRFARPDRGRTPSYAARYRARPRLTPIHPPTTIRPSVCTAIAPERSGPVPNSVVTIPPSPKEGSGEPLGRYRRLKVNQGRPCRSNPDRLMKRPNVWNHRSCFSLVPTEAKCAEGDRELPATQGHEKEPDEPEDSLKGIAVAIDPGSVPQRQSRGLQGWRTRS